ncbi:P450 monooxygenase [Metarhizium album ARSEF 1941]|uniref:p450 monooxygenase n=1 Tax=Metarhizium album (strain ARSEF 1941) TaxID=1081103 RepID=A0A0B2WLW1_METAS|nr:P450 monooxygenase [Metarhizium album ARSEF 1941]KHN94005.1 P450 monooxygenase [Metarhizium album ARSEF 1941]
MEYNNSTEFLLGNALLEIYHSAVYNVPLRQVVAAILVLVLCASWYRKPSTGLEVPFAGFRSSWEPRFFSQFRYMFSAASMIDQGYAECKDSMFQISRHDGDVLVLSRNYLEDLHNRPPAELSAIHGLIENFGGRYSGITLLAKHDVGIRALQAKITPNLAKLCDDMTDELEYSLRTDLPPCHEWTSVPIQPFFLRAVERIVHRIFVGSTLCRDPEWLKAAFGHADNVTITQIAMRSVPTVLRPLLNLCLPFSWKYKACIRAGKKILIPEVERRRELERSGVDYLKSNDLLQAMLEMTSPEDEDGQPDTLANLMMTMTAIAGHSTAASGSHALFDLVSRPEYIDLLRQEAETTLTACEMRFTKQTLADLRKMDSFLRESQRHNPLSLLGFLRVVKAPAGITLQDGTHVPYGAQLCIPPASISRDPEILDDAESFDGLRYYEQRRQDPSQDKKHQYATADKVHLHFGYGKWACPGRFMASDMLKMILATLLLRYDIKYPEGTGRPTNGYIHEFPFLNINTPLLMKRRDEMPFV